MSELIESYTEIIGFYIIVDVLLIVDVLEASYHLVGEHQHCFQGKSAKSLVKEGLEGRASRSMTNTLKPPK
jgi:hypothetical protein